MSSVQTAQGLPVNEPTVPSVCNNNGLSDIKNVEKHLPKPTATASDAPTATAYATTDAVDAATAESVPTDNLAAASVTQEGKENVPPLNNDIPPLKENAPPLKTQTRLQKMKSFLNKKRDRGNVGSYNKKKHP